MSEALHPPADLPLHNNPHLLIPLASPLGERMLDRMILQPREAFRRTLEAAGEGVEALLSQEWLHQAALGGLEVHV